ncbi:MAG TPA: formate/nitrite transporter family protein [Balneolaceae bacterium]|nr:formate/nitrite transporter family protein [Balneolaceae bacterium]
MRQQEEASHEAEERTSPKALVIFEAIRREGKQELERPPSSLAWSGLAAGLSMGFSMIAEALIASHLPDAPWTPLVSKFGYSIGFLIVILGRQQLFTEDTLTPVLQLFDETTADIWKKITRLWLIVFLANIAGAFIFSFVVSHVFIFEPIVYSQFNTFAQSTVENSFGITFFRAVFAGWLIALIIWILPFAEQARFWVIIVITYLIGIGDLAHIIVGSIEGFYGLFANQITFIAFTLKFFIPALLGNIVGGVALVAAINYAQINYERGVE